MEKIEEQTINAQEQRTESPAMTTPESAPVAEGGAPKGSEQYVAYLEAKILELTQALETKASSNDEAPRAQEEDKPSESARIAELEAEIARLKAENERLAFIVDNPDIAPYRDILPAGDIERLKAAADVIRRANRFAPGGAQRIPTPAQTPKRRFESAPTPEDITAYVESAPTLEERRRRLDEIRMMLS